MNNMKRRRFNLRELYDEIFMEALDFKNIQTYPLKYNHEGCEFDAELSSTESTEVYVYVEETEGTDRFVLPWRLKSAKSVVNFGFEISTGRITTQLAKIEYKYYIRILATVGKYLTEYINTKKPDLVTFFSDNKSGEKGIDPQKDDIYFMSLEKNTPFGYRLDKIYDNSRKKEGIVLYKI